MGRQEGHGQNTWVSNSEFCAGRGEVADTYLREFRASGQGQKQVLDHLGIIDQHLSDLFLIVFILYELCKLP